VFYKYFKAFCFGCLWRRKKGKKKVTKTKFSTKMLELSLAAEQGSIHNGTLVQKGFANSNISYIQVPTSPKDKQKVL